MPVPRSASSVFSFGAGVEKIRRCDVELLRRMVLWEVSTGLSMWTAAPAMGDRGWGIAGAKAFRLQVRQRDRLRRRIVGVFDASTSPLKMLWAAPKML